jgi:hypothetical protein
MVVERLEPRALLAYTPLGYSLPELKVSGYTSSSASWGSSLTVTLNVQNLGASTLIEPTQLLPLAPSHADSSPTTVDLFLSRTPHPTRGKDTVLAAVISIPSIKQNNLVQISKTVTLPAQPAGFPGDGGMVFASFLINPMGQSPDLIGAPRSAISTSNPILIEAPFPQLDVTSLDVPPVIQPGDTIAPTIRIINVGPAATAPQGPFTVTLVASTQPKLNGGTSTVATYTVNNIPGISQVSSGTHVTTDANVNPQNNIVTIVGAPVTLPVKPKVYFIGVVVDPQHKLVQIQANHNLQQATRVGPPIRGLPAAGVVYAGGGTSNLPFPYPPNVKSVVPPTVPQTGIKTS